MRVAYPHGTTPAAARARIDAEAERLHARYANRISSAHYGWTDDVLHFSASAMGATLNGSVTVTETEAILEATVPLYLRAFEGRAKSRILDTFREMFG